MLQKLWKWSWLLTLPISLVFIITAYQTMTRYYNFGIRYQRTPATINLHETGLFEARHLWRQIQLAVTGQHFLNHGKSKLKEINLYVSEANINQLNSNLPYSGFKYVKGAIQNGEKLQKIKYRYRGDLPYHWARHKKSIRVKTKKKNLFEGLRAFNLIAPKRDEMFHTYLGIKLAEKFDLIAPVVDMVNVSINGQPQGVHVLVEQIEELTLRRMGVMPGDLYAGELFSKDKITGISSSVFDHPGAWEKRAVNNHFNEASHKPLEALLKLINTESSEENHRQLSAMLDMEAWGRFAAFEVLAQTFHYDDTHNWRLYYDPWKTQFVPIVWDPTGWMWMPRPGARAIPDAVSSRLHIKLTENGDYLKARHLAITQFFKQQMDVQFIRESKVTAHKVSHDVVHDPHLGRLTNRKTISSEQNPANVIAMQRQFINGIQRVFKNIKSDYIYSPSTLSYKRSNNVIALQTSGRKPIKDIVLNFEQNISAIAGARISYWRNDKKVTRDVFGAAKITGNKISFNLDLLSQFIQSESSVRYPRKSVSLANAYYELSFDNLGEKNNLIEVLYGDSKDKLVAANPNDGILHQQFARMYQLTPNAPLELPIIWQGEKVIEGLSEIHQTLIIKPGTTVRFKANASLILNNRLIAEGTPEHPIHFVAYDESKEPWGTFALKGLRASGSRLSFCTFANGSGIKNDLYEYSAMFSVHHVHNVSVNNCEFRDSKRVDDMVHAVYSTITFSNSEFIRAKSDAVDLDISHAKISHSRFINSGNDAIDLMTTDAIVTDSVFINNRDKGVSVGEESELLAINNIFTGNEIAVQAKDASRAYIYNADIEDNKRSLDAYKKNWRYGQGGNILVSKSRIERNGSQMSADKKSKILVYDSYVDNLAGKQDKRVVLDTSVDASDKKLASHPKISYQEKSLVMLKAVDDAVWRKIDPARRGAFNAN